MKPAKLGMTVQPPKRTPYDKLGARMEQGEQDEAKLMRPGTPYQQRLQNRIPKVTPTAKSGRGRA